MTWQPLTLPVTEEQERFAQRFRAYRDAKFGYNRYPEDGNEVRWYGDLAELRVWSWLKACHYPHVWLNDPAKGQADFLIGGRAIEVKQKKCAMMPRAHFGLTLVDHPIAADYLLFTSYQYKARVLWVHGFTTVAEFMLRATHHEAGESVGALVMRTACFQVEGMDWLMPVQALARMGVAA